MVRRLIAAAAIAALMLAVACSSTGAGNTVRFQIFGDPAEAAAYKSLIAAFREKNPDVTVDLVVVGSQGDHMTKLATAFSGGNPPDLFLLNYRLFGQFAGQGVLEPVGPLAESKVTLPLTNFYPQALDGFRFSGTLMCLPQNISSPVVYYNKTLFQSAGVEAPKTGWTWTDMREKAQALTRDGNRGIGFEPSLNRFAPFIWQAGGNIVDNLQTPKTMSLLEPGAIEALRYLTDLQHRYHVTPTKAEAESEDLEARFSNGRLGMFIDSRRFTTSLRGVKNLDWDVAPLPVHPTRKQPAVMLHSDAYCMAKASKNKDAAFRFVAFALAPEGQLIIARTGRTVPVNQTVAEGSTFLDPTQKPAAARVFLDQIPAIRRFPNIATWNEIETKADVIVEEWFYGAEAPPFLGLEIDVATLELFQPRR